MRITLVRIKNIRKNGYSIFAFGKSRKILNVIGG